MGVRHTFNVAIADDGDPTNVDASHWNADHTIDAATITLAMMANLANKRLIGRNTAGTGVPESVTATQLFDWVSATNGVLLTRTGGTWAALANVTTDAGDLVHASNPTAAAPAAGTKLHGIAIAGRDMLATIGVDGVRHTLGAWGAQRTVARYQVIGGGLVDTIGMRHDVSGTATARAVAGTGLFAAARRVGYVSAAGAGSVGGVRSAASWLTRYGGFHFVFRFANGDTTAWVNTSRMFVGVHNGTGALTDADPSGLTNLIGFGGDSGQTTMRLFAAGAVAQAATDLGANFPINTIDTDIYEAHLYCPPNGADVRYQLIRLNTGHTVSGVISAAAALPAAATTLTLKGFRMNGGTAAVVSLEMFGAQVESEI